MIVDSRGLGGFVYPTLVRDGGDRISDFGPVLLENVTPKSSRPMPCPVVPRDRRDDGGRRGVVGPSSTRAASPWGSSLPPEPVLPEVVAGHWEDSRRRPFLSD